MYICHDLKFYEFFFFLCEFNTSITYIIIEFKQYLLITHGKPEQWGLLDMECRSHICMIRLHGCMHDAQAQSVCGHASVLLGKVKLSV